MSIDARILIIVRREVYQIGKVEEGGAQGNRDKHQPSELTMNPPGSSRDTTPT